MPSAGEFLGVLAWEACLGGKLLLLTAELLLLSFNFGLDAVRLIGVLCTAAAGAVLRLTLLLAGPLAGDEEAGAVRSR